MPSRLIDFTTFLPQRSMPEQPAYHVLPPWQHQLEAYHFAYDKPACMLAMAMGCVDCDTEYLSPTGWVPISKYLEQSNQMVAQFEPDTRTMTFVRPAAYIALPCDGFYHFKHARGLDQMLSPEHRVLLYDHKRMPRHFSAEDVYYQERGTKQARFYAAATYRGGGTGIQLADHTLRLQLAVIADGHFPCGTNYCIVGLTKQRKKDRLEYLLERTGTLYKTRPSTQPGRTNYVFYAPVHTKHFTVEWWEATYAQRKLICDEVPYWDGSHVKAEAHKYFTTSKGDADFIQYCFFSTGRRASLQVSKRPGRDSTDYTVHAVGEGRSGNYIHFARQNGNAEVAAAKDGLKYCFEVPSGNLVLRRNGCVFTTGNTGKSKVAVDLVNNWYADRDQQPQKILILCPKSVIGVWPREFATHSFFSYNVVPLHKGTTEQKTDRAKEAFDAHGNTVIVLNYESAISPAFKKWSLSRNWDVVILDESHRAKSATTATSKYCTLLRDRARRRLCLTGTPMPHGPLDIFGQYRFLDPSIYGPYWTRFRKRYAVMPRPDIPMITGYKNQDELQALMAPIAFRVDDSVLDLPDKRDIIREVELEPKGLKHYRNLEREFVTEAQSGTVTVANAMVKSLRLRQVTSGYVKVDDTGEEEIVGREKQEALEDIMQDLGPNEPLVVFCQFRHDLARVRESAEKLAKKHKVVGKGWRYGEISGVGKKALTEHAQMPDDVDVLGVQLQSGSLGIDLTRAAYGVYYSHPWSLGDYDQSRKRIDRPGQERDMTYYHLVCKGTVDKLVMQALDKKRDVVETVLSVLKRADLERVKASPSKHTEVFDVPW